MRLIDADSLIARCAKLKYSSCPVEVIKSQPTVDAAPVVYGEWISVKDRLPESDEKVLCCYHFGENSNMPFISVLDYYATDPIPHFQHEKGAYSDERKTCFELCDACLHKVIYKVKQQIKESEQG